MAYAILRIKKLGAKNLGGWLAHVQRSRNTPNADPEREHVPLTKGNALERANDRLNEHKVPRGDSPAGIEVMLTMSPEVGQRLTHEKVQEWAKDNMSFLEQFFGQGSTTYAELHLDETTPHIHALVQPLDDKGRVNVNEYIGGDKGRIKLRKLQDQYAECMKGYGLERGVEKSRARHEEIRKWYGQIQEGLRNDPPTIETGILRNESAEHYRERIKDEWHAMTTLAQETINRQRIVERNVELENENKQLKDSVQKLEQTTRTLTHEVEHYKTQTRRLQAEIERIRPTHNVERGLDR